MNREGKKYKVIIGDHDFDKGDILVLTHDDGDEVPWFRSTTTDVTALMPLRNLEELKEEEIKMTKKIVGRQYKVIGDTGTVIRKGDTVTLKFDDHSEMPLFRRESDGEERYIRMENVKLIKKPKHKVGKKYLVTGNGSEVRHFFEEGEIVELTRICRDEKTGEFRNKKGIGQTVSFKDVARLTKKVEAGMQAVVLSTDLTDSRHGIVESMAKVGEIVKVEKISGATNRIVRAKKEGGRLFSYAIEDVRGIKSSKELDIKGEPAKPKFKKGDIVRITGNTNSSRNKVGDIGVIADEVVGNNAVRVDVPNRIGGNGNWTKQDEMESLGLKGEVKK